EVDDRGDAGEVLQQHPRGHEGDLFVRDLVRVPARQLLDVRGLDDPAVLAPQQVFEQDLERVRKLRDRQAAPLQRIQPVDLKRARAGFQRGAAAEAVRAHCGRTFTATTKYSVSPKQLVGTPLCCW